jgi:mannose-6-phosphate isomerase-like protein (cupin superfamily)
MLGFRTSGCRPAARRDSESRRSRRFARSERRGDRPTFEFTWHHHDDTDDFFLVLKGRIVIRLRDGDVELGPGELFVVPGGVEHQPVAVEEAELLLIEPTGTPNTGDPETAARRIEI